MRPVVIGWKGTWTDKADIPASLSGFQGKVTFPNGYTLEGSFDSVARRGLYTQGVLDMAAPPPDPSSTCKR